MSTNDGNDKDSPSQKLQLGDADEFPPLPGSSARKLRLPTAETWVRLMNGPTGSNGQGDGLSIRSKTKKLHTLSALATEFVPQFVHQMVPQEPEEEPQLPEEFQRLVSLQNQLQLQSSDSDAVNAFRATLLTLMTQPGNIEEYMNPVIELLKSYGNDELTMQNIIELLFEQSIMEPNFRYTGARIVQYLSARFKDITHLQNFRARFLQRCQLEYMKKADLISNPTTVSRLCGLTLFFGEMFLAIEVFVDGRLQKMSVIRIVLRELVKTLLEHHSLTTVKAAVQVLKLCGAVIDDTRHLKHSEEPGYDDVYQQIQVLSTTPGLDRTQKCLLQSVLSLRESNWGRRDSSDTESEASIAGSSHRDLIENEPVFYGKGMPISREEAGFQAEYAVPDSEGYSELVEPYPQWSVPDQGQNHYSSPTLRDYPQYPIEEELAYSSPTLGDDQQYPTEEELAWVARNDIYADSQGDMNDEVDADFEEFLRQQYQN